jgi:hypothetical protein
MFCCRHAAAALQPPFRAKRQSVLPTERCMLAAPCPAPVECRARRKAADEDSRRSFTGAFPPLTRQMPYRTAPRRHEIYARTV